MPSNLEQLEGLAYKISIEVPAEIVDASTVERLKKIRSSAKIDGFRRGKIPPNILKQRYGQAAREEAVREEIDRSYRQALQEHDKIPVSYPNIELQSGFKEGEALKFTATFEVAPKVEAKGLDALEITLPESKIEDSDVASMRDILLRQQGKYVVNNDKEVADTDRVKVDYVGRLDGVEFDGGKGEDVSIVVAGGQMLEDFDNGLKGMKVGVEKTFDVHFPEGYANSELAGKTAQFTATVKQIEFIELPEFNADFIKIFGIESGAEEDFNKAVRENMQRELDNAIRRIRRSRLFDELLKHNADIPVPHAALDEQMRQMGEEQLQLSKQITDKEKYHQFLHQLYEEPAKRHLQLTYLLGGLFSERKIELDQERVNQRIETIASTYEDPNEVKEFYQKDRRARQNVESEIFEEQLIDNLYQSAKVSVEQKTFQEVMTINSQIRF
ncbi:MAG: trigger factor [Cardiobacteriaceae bacterium]|nr:trigger factor [Cardiobacteriaceae bacterium]